jgi:NodT family efflux transporter outer membrane factor (OMF) lipoprotein
MNFNETTERGNEATAGAWLAALSPLFVALAGCGSLLVAPAASDDVRPAAPAAWQAPLPHDGKIADLANWWAQFDDPLLPKLIVAAQDVSPTLASATSRIEQARAARVASGAALLPSVSASGSFERAKDPGQPHTNTSFGGLSTSWELDLFGANRAGSNAAAARFDAAHADWHDARTLVAAEVANSYVSLRACEARLIQVEIDAASRNESARLTALTAASGFQSPGNAALARASAAQGQVTVTQQRAQCDLNVKALVALTALSEPVLRSELAASQARIPQPAAIRPTGIPAETLAQRPDLHSAAKSVIASSADVSQQYALRFPRITLSGSFGHARVETPYGSTSGTTWAFGPIAVSLPIFDGGMRAANVEAAKARYDEAAALYRSKLRTAVREVEEALVNLQSTADRTQDAQIAAAGFNESFRATEARYRGGLASLFELEDARRSDVSAQTALVDLQRERVQAWIALYKALGGGWSVAPAPDSPHALQTIQIPCPQENT